MQITINLEVEYSFAAMPTHSSAEYVTYIVPHNCENHQIVHRYLEFYKFLGYLNYGSVYFEVVNFTAIAYTNIG